MVLLQQLPTELLQEIISYLHEDSEVDSILFNLCCQCHILRDIVQPLLFKSLRASYHEVANHEAFSSLESTFRVRPHLAKAVRFVTFYPSKLADDNGVSNSIEDMRRFSKRLPAFLSYLTNVNRLSLQGGRFLPFDDPDHPGGKIKSLLPRLEKLRISPASASDSLVNIREYLPFFFHPGLRTLTIELGASYISEDLWDIGDVPADAFSRTSIEELNILDCFIHTNSIRTLVKNCTGLKTLRYQGISENHKHRLLHDGDSEEERMYLFPPTFQEVLERYGDTLKELLIDSESPIAERSTVRGDLVALRKLQYLEMGHRAIRSISRLPPNLNHLVITHCPLRKSGIVTCIYELLEASDIRAIRVRFETVPREREVWLRGGLLRSLKKTIARTEESACCLFWEVGERYFFRLCNPAYCRNRVEWRCSLFEMDYPEMRRPNYIRESQDGASYI